MVNPLMNTADFKITELPQRNGLHRVQVQWPRGLRGKFEINGCKRSMAGLASVFRAPTLKEAHLTASEAVDQALFAHISARMGVNQRVRAMQRHNLKHAS